MDTGLGEVPGGGQAQELGEQEAHPQTGSAALGENSTAPMTPQPQEVDHKRPGQEGLSAPLIWMGKVSRGRLGIISIS